ncbi:hypothetical protein I6A60_13705 [Frankia sp. AgB1.9]|uniref:hypothetical protein n=1 Tax=unclassified Frankia TaxID=2632575 RepID=UPI0019347D97|nr:MULTISPECIES: hypothetical protein [unclassified Frankia]MBL7487608.1 hypothetical protein [Frankia sp. AgW1.1]MBL7548926.1 hypothetical protein [Frankia sp. AgB1.9]MBL7624894.1 hypothetical protein [Frankia sp. AgB1.8]
MDTEATLAAGRAIQPRLKDILAPAAAADAAERLDEILAADSSEPAMTAAAVRALLDEHDDTARFLRRFLDDPSFRTLLEPDGGPLNERSDGIDLLAGDPGPIDADLYRCPQGDYEWEHLQAGESIPECPVHHVALVRS